MHPASATATGPNAGSAGTLAWFRAGIIAGWRAVWVRRGFATSSKQWPGLTWVNFLARPPAILSHGSGTPQAWENDDVQEYSGSHSLGAAGEAGDRCRGGADARTSGASRCRRHWL